MAKSAKDIFKKVAGAFTRPKRYSLKTAIQKNDLYKKPIRAASRTAISRIRGGVKAHGKSQLKMGTLCFFKYLNPKTKDRLAYYDTSPMVIVLGYKKGEGGVKLEMGLNLHFIPRDKRMEVLVKLFNFYRNIYDKARKKGTVGEFSIDYNLVVSALSEYKVKFALRSYIPSRRRKTYIVPVNEWENAIFIEPTFRKEDANTIYSEYNNYKQI